MGKIVFSPLPPSEGRAVLGRGSLDSIIKEQKQSTAATHAQQSIKGRRRTGGAAEEQASVPAPSSTATPAVTAACRPSLVSEYKQRQAQNGALMQSAAPSAPPAQAPAAKRASPHAPLLPQHTRPRSYVAQIKEEEEAKRRAAAVHAHSQGFSQLPPHILSLASNQSLQVGSSAHAPSSKYSLTEATRWSSGNGCGPGREGLLRERDGDAFGKCSRVGGEGREGLPRGHDVFDEGSRDVWPKDRVPYVHDTDDRSYAPQHDEGRGSRRVGGRVRGYASQGRSPSPLPCSSAAAAAAAAAGYEHDICGGGSSGAGVRHHSRDRYGQGAAEGWMWGVRSREGGGYETVRERERSKEWSGCNEERDQGLWMREQRGGGVTERERIEDKEGRAGKGGRDNGRGIQQDRSRSRERSRQRERGGSRQQERVLARREHEGNVERGRDNGRGIERDRSRLRERSRQQERERERRTEGGRDDEKDRKQQRGKRGREEEEKEGEPGWEDRHVHKRSTHEARGEEGDDRGLHRACTAHLHEERVIEHGGLGSRRGDGGSEGDRGRQQGVPHSRPPPLPSHPAASPTAVAAAGFLPSCPLNRGVPYPYPSPSPPPLKSPCIPYDAPPAFSIAESLPLPPPLPPFNHHAEAPATISPVAAGSLPHSIPPNAAPTLAYISSPPPPLPPIYLVAEAPAYLTASAGPHPSSVPFCCNNALAPMSANALPPPIPVLHPATPATLEPSSAVPFSPSASLCPAATPVNAGAMFPSPSIPQAAACEWMCSSKNLGAPKAEDAEAKEDEAEEEIIRNEAAALARLLGSFSP